MRIQDDLEALIRTTVEPMGYELVGAEYFPGRGKGLLRVYIDQEAGISLDDCAAVSHQLEGVLTVEDPIPGQYDLEVSSPGLDRPLFTVGHYQRFTGRRARIRLSARPNERHRFEGILRGVRDSVLLLEVGKECLELPLDRIESARLVPELPFGGSA